MWEDDSSKGFVLQRATSIAMHAAVRNPCLVSHFINWFVELRATVITSSFSAFSGSRKCHYSGLSAFTELPLLWLHRKAAAGSSCVARTGLAILPLPASLPPAGKRGKPAACGNQTSAFRESLSPACIGHSGPSPTSFPASLGSLSQTPPPEFKIDENFQRD